jgi:hypothetical protein
MIIVKLISGLGNQLFQYAIGRQLSLLRNTPLKLDISFFKGQNLRSFKLSHFNIIAELATANEIARFTGNRLDQRIYRKTLRMVSKNKWNYYPESEWWVYEPGLFRTTSNVYLDGYWQHYKYFENIHPLIFDELTLKEKYNGQETYLVSEIQSQPSASVHVRRGDYLLDNLMNVLPIEYYKKAINYLKKEIHNVVFYIFSDDLDWVKDNLHQDGPFVYVEIADGQKDYVELDIMSKCNHNIIANSSFSWWAAFLNKNPEKIVVSPAQWVKTPEINDKISLQFPTWVKMQ